MLADRYGLALPAASDAARDAYVTHVGPIMSLAQPDAARGFRSSCPTIPSPTGPARDYFLDTS